MSDELANNRLTIALDYDDTYTADPKLWQQFIIAAQTRGHRVFIVTQRFRRCEVDPIPELPVPHYVYTGMEAKRPYCRDKLGMHVDIWIDDSPEFILEPR